MAPIAMKDLLIQPPDGSASFSPDDDNQGRVTAKVPMLHLNATTLNTGRNWRLEAVRMGEARAGIGVNVILTRGKRRQWNFKFCLTSEHWMQMGEGARLSVVNQKEMHQFAMVRDERRPSAAMFRSVHVDFQNGLVVFGAHLGRHGKRLVEGIVPVVAVFEVPPFLSAKNQERKSDCGQRHSRAPPPPVFLCLKHSRIETTLAENRSGNLSRQRSG